MLSQAAFTIRWFIIIRMSTDQEACLGPLVTSVKEEALLKFSWAKSSVREETKEKFLGQTPQALWLNKPSALNILNSEEKRQQKLPKLINIPCTSITGISKQQQHARKKGKCTVKVRAWAKAIEVQSTLYWLSMDSRSTHCERTFDNTRWLKEQV